MEYERCCLSFSAQSLIMNLVIPHTTLLPRFMKHTPTIILLVLFCACTEINEYGLVENPTGSALDDRERRMNEFAVTGLAVAPDVEVELFAAEPMLVNPTNIAVDERGRVWVCEGINYRPDLNPQNPIREEAERIVILEDTDGDARADRRTVFYEGHDINSALGIWVMGNQAIISVSPNVFVLTDDDGDDKADRKELLFTGIGGEQHDHGVHAFIPGPDGRFYFNFGNSGEQLLDADSAVVVDRAGRPVVADGNPYRQGMVFRMDRDGSNLEVLGHNFRNNYEIAIDSYGTLWQSDNDDDGNRATRINFVMEYGNYGFRDEMTGANWRTRRTGMHEEIPKRHWHLNDPGVVPNLLQTGAGSPTGMVIYEGALLPERFHGQMIHADAGPNVVRAYPIAEDGAGYKAEIVNILKGMQDKWFRPSDVAVAPDGSLIVADWYDPGVGGHHVGDLAKGRLFRIAPPGTPYSVPNYKEYHLPRVAIEMLKNPNLAVRHLGWLSLFEAGSDAEDLLLSLWNGDNPRLRAQSLWLLGQIAGLGEMYVEQAINDPDPNIRITGLRLARQIQLDLVPILEHLVQDSSAQVRREVAIALRHLDAPEAPGLWTTLASQYDGEDRWYLEALGIAADEQWDSFFSTWMKQNAENWDTPAARNLIWRSRSSDAIPMLASMIKDPATTITDRLRYFRAFDFHTDQQAKEAELAGLLETGNQDIAVLALLHLATDELIAQPAIQTQLTDVLNQVEGTRAYLDLVDHFDIADQRDALFAMAISNEDKELQTAAADLLLQLGGKDVFEEALQATQDNEETGSILALLGRVGSDPAREVTETYFLNSEMPIELRRTALHESSHGWRGQNRLIELLEEGRFPEELKETAASIIFSSGDDRRHVRAAKYLDPPAGIGGDPLPPIATMVEQEGDVLAGQQSFSQLCSSCHIVQGEGIDYGPDLSEIGSKLPREALYNAILFPSAGIGFGFEGVALNLKDGGQAIGYMLSRNDEAIQLREAGGQSREYAMENIESIEQLDQSLMPALGASMGEQQLVDLIAYLESLVSL